MHTGSANFYQYAGAVPDKVAVIEASGASVTYGNLYKVANRISHALRDESLQAGDRVSLLSSNTADFLALLLGAEQVGITVVPVNYHLTAPEIAYIIESSSSTLLFVEGQHLPAAMCALPSTSLPPDRCITLGHPASAGRMFADFIDRRSEAPPPERVHGSVMLYTSGTTGRPKGVNWPARKVDPETAAQSIDPVMALRGMKHDLDAVSIVTGPLYHGAPLGWGLQALHHGHTVVLMEKWDSKSFLQKVQHYGATTAQLAPIHFHRLLQLSTTERRRYDTGSLKVVSHSGAATPDPTKRRMLEWLGPVLFEYYASSEGYGTSITSADWLEHPGSVGRADGNGAHMKILDDLHNPMPAGEVGTLWIQNPGGLTSEYFGDPDKTAAAHLGTYFTTGDMAYIDQDGWLFIADRRTDMILSGGVNIYPAEVEDVMRVNAAIDDIAVLGLPDDEWGQRVHAVDVPSSTVEAGDVLAQEILSATARSLAKFKIPKTLEFRESIPYSPTGKLLRRVLRDELTH
jgi:long-chain acyl-CoA synthetase